MSLTPETPDLEDRLRRVLGESASEVSVPFPPPVLRTSRAGRRRVRRPSRSLAVGGVIGSLILAGGGYALAEHATSGPVTNLSTARCYSEPSVGHGADFAGTTVAATGTPGTKEFITDAVGTCRALWEQGFLELGVPRPLRVQLPVDERIVPNLAACVLSDGRAAVIPGNAGVCAELGLRSALGGVPGSD